MTKQPIEKDDLYHLSAHIIEQLEDYGAIRYLDEEGKSHILLVVDEIGGNNDRLVRLDFEFVFVLPDRRVSE